EAHRRRSIQLGFAAAVALVLTWLLVVGLQQVDNPRFHETLTSPITMRVLIAAAAGYTVFMFAVRNLLLLLTLARVDAAVRSVAYALAANVSVGFVCSRAIGYWAAVAGVVAGSIVLCIVAARETRRVLEELDYTYYAAY
ncbi:MAG: hypothetical protein QOJ98_503, partial [Acidobacteriota bacterium]|nr:hypothetical protein [Acidobacteriota bacterium]